MKTDVMAKDLEPGDVIEVEVKDLEVDDSQVTVKTRIGEFTAGLRSRVLTNRPAERKPAGEGGEMGQAIRTAFKRAGKKGVSPAEVAERTGASVARVYEVIRGADKPPKRISRGRYAG